MSSNLHSRIDRVEHDLAQLDIDQAEASEPIMLNLLPSGEGFALIGNEWVPCADVHQAQREHPLATLYTGFAARDV